MIHHLTLHLTAMAFATLILVPGAKAESPEKGDRLQLMATLQHERGVRRVAISPDGQSIITAAFGCKTRIWDMKTAKARAEPRSHAGDVMTVAFSPDSKMALTSDWNRLQIWDVATGKENVQKIPHWIREDTIIAPVFSPDSARVATRSSRTTSQIWSTTTGKPVCEPLPQNGTVRELKFTPDGRLLLTRGAGTVRAWDARTGKAAWEPIEHGNGISAFAISPDSRVVATGSPDKTARVWDLKTGRPVGEPLPHDFGVRGIRFGKNGTLLTVDNRNAWLWTGATTKKPNKQICRHGAWMGSPRFFPDGLTALTYSYKSISAWRKGQEKPLWERTSTGPVRRKVMLSPNGTTVLAIDIRRKVAEVLDARTGDLLRALPKVQTGAFSQNGILVTGGDLGARIWKIREKK